MSSLQENKTIANAFNKRIERADNKAPRNQQSAERRQDERVVNWLACVANL